jgi:hypothetical protein
MKTFQVTIKTTYENESGWDHNYEDQVYIVMAKDDESAENKAEKCFKKQFKSTYPQIMQKNIDTEEIFVTIIQ